MRFMQTLIADDAAASLTVRYVGWVGSSTQNHNLPPRLGNIYRCQRGPVGRYTIVPKKPLRGSEALKLKPPKPLEISAPKAPKPGNEAASAKRPMTWLV